MTIDEMQAGDELDWLVFRYVSNPTEYADETHWQRRKMFNDDWKGTSQNIRLAWIWVIESLQLTDEKTFAKFAEALGGLNQLIRQKESDAALAICKAALIALNVKP